MKALNFREFISEEKENKDPFKVVIITKANPTVRRRRSGEKSRRELTVSLLTKSCKKRNIPCFIVNTKTAFVADKDINKGTVTISNLDADEHKEEFEGRNTCVICRAGAIDDSAGLALMAAFEVAGSFMINTREAMLTADNKLSTTILFEQYGIPQPKTSFVSNEKQIESALEKIGGKFPVVIKTLTGTQGIGISIVESLESLVSNIQSLFKHNAELLIQEYLKIEYDIRTFVINGKIFASTKRTHKGDFRSNLHRGATSEPYKLNDEEIKVILRAARASKGYMVGVDHLIHNDKIYVLEVNGSPGTGALYEGYSYKSYEAIPTNRGQITGKQLANNIIRYISNRAYWDPESTREVGWLETMKLKNIGRVRAKLDTGNGSYACTLHAEKIKINTNKKEVYWTYNKKRYKSKLQDISKVYRANTAGDNDDVTERRPVIHLDVIFNGGLYSDVEIGLDARVRSHSDLLINRNTIRRMNVSVNPSRTFVLSRRIKPIDKGPNK